MTSLAIVEHLNVFEDGGLGLCPRSQGIFCWPYFGTGDINA